MPTITLTLTDEQARTADDWNRLKAQTLAEALRANAQDADVLWSLFATAPNRW